MASKTDIWNTALRWLGAGRVEDPETDGSEEAEVLRDIYPMAFDAVLRMHLWNFAKCRVELSPSVTVPAFGWSHYYKLPGNFVRMVPLKDDQGNPLQYELETAILEETEGDTTYDRVIAIDDGGPLQIKYIRRCANEGEFDALAAYVLAAFLASELAVDLTLDTKKRELAEAKFREFHGRATALDGMESPLAQPNQDAFEVARL